jgi:hypothetical protein
MRISSLHHLCVYLYVFEVAVWFIAFTCASLWPTKTGPQLEQQQDADGSSRPQRETTTDQCIFTKYSRYIRDCAHPS